MPISFGLTSNLSISQNLSVGGTAAIGSSLTLSDTTASSLLYGNASKVVSSVTLASNLSLTTGTLALATALTSINSVTAGSGTALTLSGGSSGASLVLGQGTTAGVTVAAGATGGTATAVNTGGLRSANFGLSTVSGGASYFGGQVFTTGSTSGFVVGPRDGATPLSTWYATGGNTLLDITGGPSTSVSIAHATGNWTFPKVTNVSNTTSASSSTVGALTIGNGTAATNVAIGGGNINAGGTITAGFGTFAAPSLIVGDAQYGIYTGGGQLRFKNSSTGNIVFRNVGDTGDSVSINPNTSAVTISGVLNLPASNATLELGAIASTNTPVIDFHSSASSTDYDARIIASGGTASAGAGVLTLQAGRISIDSTTPATTSTSAALAVAGGIYAGAASVFGGAATFAGAVTLPSATIANGTGTKKLLFYNASSGSSTISLSDDSTEVAVQTFTKSGANVTTAFGGVTILKNYTVATLPAAASYTYGTAFVSDATNAAGTGGGTAPTGGGAVKRLVYSDGTNWLLQ